MRLYWVAALAASVTIVAGCSSGGVDTSTASPTARSSAPTAVVKDPPGGKLITEIPKAPARGANAAPGTPLPYLTGPEAASAFTEWWRYELQSTDDEKRGVRQAYIDGIAACLARSKGAGTDPTLTVLERDLGWTRGGAAAIYAAALRGLCPQFDGGEATADGTINGYKTYFDEQVNLSHPLVVQATQQFGLAQQPNHIDVGWLGKYACSYMTQQRTSVGLLNYLQTSVGSWLGIAANPAVAQAATKQAVTNMCPAHMVSVGAW